MNQRQKVQKRYQETHKEQLAEYNRRYYQEHKEELRQKRQEYRDNNRDKVKKWSRTNYLKRKEMKNNVEGNGSTGEQE